MAYNQIDNKLCKKSTTLKIDNKQKIALGEHRTIVNTLLKR